MQPIRIPTPAGSFAALACTKGGESAPWLHFAHATGMHARLYARLLAPLAGRFNILASDARGHGGSRAIGSPDMLVSWADMAGDLAAIIAAIAPEARWLLAGHSLGAVVSIYTAAAAPQRCAGLVLVDPPVRPFALATSGAPLPNPMVEQAGRRRPSFASRAEARAAYAGRGVFASWADADLDVYLDGGLVAAPDGVALACTPAWEAATFAAWPRDLAATLARVATPFTLLAADQHSTIADAELAAFVAHPACRGARRVPGSDHFLPLSHGQAVRDAIVALAHQVMPQGAA